MKEYYLNKTRNIYVPYYYALNNCKRCSNENICLSCLNRYVLLYNENLIEIVLLKMKLKKKIFSFS